ncbi:hypothetical protein KR51_00022420 [Rubidibacter lacunae KORDI 51-2]|uniref:Uncharacterized protein n=1 Tax=Rubidibacter lacunae KORDI 51-2 TaxID=582515 RepID=U5DKU4_9CHRO|nr:hypothetical protein KR51_00022420 [Rubidibacter lacunae KORDI 51-2]
MLSLFSPAAGFTLLEPVISDRRAIANPDIIKREFGADPLAFCVV